MLLGICGKKGCSQPLSRKRNCVQCVICAQCFHAKCSIPITDYGNNNIEFQCFACRELMFPFITLETEELFELFNENVFKDSIIPRKCKCACCKKNIKQNNTAAHCSICSNYFHLKCENLSKPDFPLPSTWCCSFCILKRLPFSTIGDENMTMTLHGMNDENISTLAEGATSFSIKSLLDEMSGQNFETDQFMNNTIHSKYYTIGDFSNSKFSNKKSQYCFSSKTYT